MEIQVARPVVRFRIADQSAGQEVGSVGEGPNGGSARPDAARQQDVPFVPRAPDIQGRTLSSLKVGPAAVGIPDEGSFFPLEIEAAHGSGKDLPGRAVDDVRLAVAPEDHPGFHGFQIRLDRMEGRRNGEADGKRAEYG